MDGKGHITNFPHASSLLDLWIAEQVSSVQSDTDALAVTPRKQPTVLLKDTTNVHNNGWPDSSLAVARDRPPPHSCSDPVPDFSSEEEYLLEDQESAETVHPHDHDEYASCFCAIQHDPVCKHLVKIYHPRSFQHHVVTKQLKESYQDQFCLRKNFKCPKSACKDNDRESTATTPLNWVSYRYLRTDLATGTRQVMCRFCRGKNWIRIDRYFQHLCFAHGIQTQIKPDRLSRWDSGIKVEIRDMGEFYTTRIQTIVTPFNREHLKLLDVNLIPLPKNFFSTSLRGGIKRLHVQCRTCLHWIRLGYCEYDEIVKEEFEDYDSFTSNDLENMCYTQSRARQEIEGLYENYFAHYIDCNFLHFQSKCLYVQVI